MDFDVTADLFKALGDPHRLRALHFLATATPACCQGPDGVCACDLVTHLGLAQPTVSHHMRLLTDAGLVTATRRGRWVHYALSDAGLHTAAHTLGLLQTAASRNTPPTAFPTAQSPTAQPTPA
ncbi:ArsR family transcriptional regulator [Deinococcus metalli]|uniref:ArsR family transcriptional regulator n=1 Tax=Deinococcus metalli TaxID=1141878 RepID=A0A7W8KKP6_9DEIO|nr:metalloregulator ArsR/SmtB family transcription factor [Deinococcus metalli]MBB5378766.1 ArsR family transcriptional regulator [Deinococcus metalli]GHF60139.1 hypothetical protein GCM10017781_40340 [Deinococcus metalli]